MLQRPARPICDYEGSDYRTRFWEGSDRAYEDVVERIALRRMLPSRGDTLIDIGAGYGRLADEYNGYDRVVLFDYSRTLLREAQERLGNDPRFLLVAGNWYQMPFVDDLFSAMVQVRTIHHAADVPSLFQELARIAAPGGTYVLEFANKRNLKAILRYALRRQSWSPFTHQPIEFVKLNYDFHPTWMRQNLSRAGFTPRQQRAVSHFRLAPLKQWAPTSWLATLDRLLQPSGNWLQLTPSIFVSSDHPRQQGKISAGGFFACPSCRWPLDVSPREIADGPHECPNCGRAWRVEEGLYDFKDVV